MTFLFEVIVCSANLGHIYPCGECNSRNEKKHGYKYVRINSDGKQANAPCHLSWEVYQFRPVTACCLSAGERMEPIVCLESPFRQVTNYSFGAYSVSDSLLVVSYISKWIEYRRPRPLWKRAYLISILWRYLRQWKYIITFENKTL